MITKPWPIILLAFLYILAPIPNWIVSANLSHKGLIEFARTFDHWWNAVIFFALFPTAGIAIFMVKRWSYPVFGAVMLWSFYMNLVAYLKYPTYVPIWILIAVYVVNIALVGYFLIPAVREVYRNPRLRWWESKPRYEVSIPATINQMGQKEEGKIHNISVGGVFLQLSRNYELDSLVDLQFIFRDIDCSLKGKILYQNPKITHSYGIQFEDLTINDRRNLKTLADILEKEGVARRPERFNWKTSFTEWAKTLFRSGKGLVPEIPETFRKK